MTKYTPAPWDWSVGQIYERFSPGEVIACTDGVPFAAKCAAEQNHNARLIAAAPDLLEALQNCALLLEVTDRIEAQRDPKHPLNAAYRAIEKATGEGA